MRDIRIWTRYVHPAWILRTRDTVPPKLLSIPTILLGKLSDSDGSLGGITELNYRTIINTGVKNNTNANYLNLLYITVTQT